MTKILHFVPLGLCYDYGKFQISTFFTFVRKKPKTSVTCITAENWQKWGLPTLSPKLCDLACTIFMKLSGCHKETSKFIIQQFFCVYYKNSLLYISKSSVTCITKKRDVHYASEFCLFLGGKHQNFQHFCFDSQRLDPWPN